VDRRARESVCSMFLSSFCMRCLLMLQCAMPLSSGVFIIDSSFLGYFELRPSSLLESPLSPPSSRLETSYAVEFVTCNTNTIYSSPMYSTTSQTIITPQNDSPATRSLTPRQQQQTTKKLAREPTQCSNCSEQSDADATWL
jgi:hypothetical protein